MKKGVFTIMHYLMRKQGMLSMHCSATADAHESRSSVLVGLSGTGKLVNTGWSGGGYGVGARIKLKITRPIIDAIHSGTLANAPTEPAPVFGIHVVTQVPQVDPRILIPERTWADKAAFAATAARLAGLFIDNVKNFESGTTAAVKAAGPMPVHAIGRPTLRGQVFSVIAGPMV